MSRNPIDATCSAARHGHRGSRLRRLALALPLLGALPSAWSQAAWPAARPITLIVPFSAGGSVDSIARLVAPRLAARLGQSVVIENVTGAGGAIGVGKAVGAAPDGYTLVAGPDSAIAIGKLINPAAFRFDPLKDLAPVGMLNTAPMVLVARPGLGVKTFADVVKLAKASPGKLNYATSGQGTVLHLAMEMVKQRAGIFVTHIPYRGGAQILTDVIGNQIDLAMLVSASAIPMILDRSITPIAITDARRLEVLPAVPTFDELPGLKGTVMSSWTGVFAPARTPPEIVARLNQELNAALRDPEVVAKLRDQGALPGSGSAADLGRYAQAEFQRNEAIVKTLTFKD
jgi:tripartite-type tricarboxylate transporter receptor subunit TctC